MSGSGAAAPGNGFSWEPSISANGRFVAFASGAPNLVAGDTNRAEDVFVRDRLKGTTERVSVSSNGTQGGGGSGAAAISADGRFVAFMSESRNLVADDTNDRYDVFVRDRAAGTTERVNVSSAGAQASTDGCPISDSADPCSGYPAISADGRFVVFGSAASNLVAGDPGGGLFVRDRAAGTTERADVSSGGARVGGAGGAISADGRFVSFVSGAGVLVRDRAAGTTERVDLNSAGVDANLASYGATISANGRFVAFETGASNMVAGNTGDVFVRDRVAATTEHVSVSSTGAQPTSSSFDAAISADGRFVAFGSAASNLVAGDTNHSWDVFVRDRVAATTELVSVTGTGEQGDDESDRPAISADGRFVAFDSDASNLIPGDTNHNRDVFVRDRVAGTTTLVSVRRASAPRAGKLILDPRPARAGRELTATMSVRADGAAVASARVACTASLAGRKLPLANRSFRAGSARCVWRIPQTAHGKSLKGSISATTPSGTTTKRFAARVA